MQQLPVADGASFPLYVSLEKGVFAYISNQNQGEKGTVICKIYIDGKEVSKSE